MAKINIYTIDFICIFYYLFYKQSSIISVIMDRYIIW